MDRKHLSNWGAYAAATGAALAMSTSASAEIVYSGIGVSVSIPPGAGTFASTKSFTVGGISELLAVGHHTATFGLMKSIKVPIGGALLEAISSQRKLLFITTGASHSLRKYLAGQPILGAGGFTSYGVLRTHNSDGIFGPFGPGTVSGFVGFKISSTGPLNGDLGWLRVKVFDTTSSTYPDEAEIIDGAYSDGPISAGEIPEPGTAALSLLALGASGILALRKRRREAAAK